MQTPTITPALPPPAAADVMLPRRTERSDVFTIGDEGEVIVTLPAVLTQAAYEDLKDWLDLIGRKARRKVVARTSGGDPAFDDDDDIA
jgi:hypothetical protein